MARHEGRGRPVVGSRLCWWGSALVVPLWLLACGGCEEDAGKVAVNGRCQANTDCADGICHHKICVSPGPRPNGQPCEGPGHCLSFLCHLDLCVPGITRAGGKCLHDQECEYGLCKGGFCVSAAGPDQGALDSGPGDASAEVGPGDAALDAGKGTCNNGKKDGSEECDGADLDLMTCTALTYDGGDLACKSDCTFDTTGCFHVLDKAPIAISGATPANTRYLEPALAFDGTNFLVVWESANTTTNPANSFLLARLVPDATGIPKGSGGISLCASSLAQKGAQVASAGPGKNFMVVWQSGTSSNMKINSRAVSSGGLPLGSVGVVDATPTFHQAPRVAMGNKHFLVVWNEGQAKNIHGGRVDPSGTVLDEVAGNFIFSAGSSTQIESALAYDGLGTFLIVWRDNRNSSSTGDDIYGTTVKEATKLKPAAKELQVSSGQDQESMAALAHSGKSFLVVWTVKTLGKYSIQGTVLDITGKVLKPAFPILTDKSVSVYDHLAPDVAFDGASYLVVWKDTRNGSEGDIYGGRVSAGGTLLNPGGFPIVRTTSSVERPRVAWGSKSYLVVWQDSAYTFTSYTVQGVRVGP